MFSSIPKPSSGLSGVLFSSRAFLAIRWMMPGMILGEVASGCLYLTTKLAHMGG
jgi:hypothetical protein